MSFPVFHWFKVFVVRIGQMEIWQESYIPCVLLCPNLQPYRQAFSLEFCACQLEKSGSKVSMLILSITPGLSLALRAVSCANKRLESVKCISLFVRCFSFYTKVLKIVDCVTSILFFSCDQTFRKAIKFRALQRPGTSSLTYKLYHEGLFQNTKRNPFVLINKSCEWRHTRGSRFHKFTPTLTLGKWHRKIKFWKF